MARRSRSLTAGRVAALALVGVLACERANAGDDGLAAALPVATWALDVAGFVLRVALPPGMEPLADDVLPATDDASLPGVKTVLRRGVGRPGGEGKVVGVCVRAPGSLVAGAPESMVFDKLNEVARLELDRRGRVDRFEQGPVDEDGVRFDQRYHVRLTQAFDKAAIATGETPHELIAEGRHVVGYLGATLDVLACSVACTEGARDRPLFCSLAVDSVRVEGPFVTPPHASFFGRVEAASVRRPVKAAGIFAGFLMAVSGLVAMLSGARRGRRR